LQSSELAAGDEEEGKLKEVVVVVEEEEEEEEEEGSQERLDRLRASTVALKNASSEYCSFLVVEKCAPEICG
jgi:hypothetical protein